MPHQQQDRVEHARSNIDFRVDAKRSAQMKNIEVWRALTGRASFNEAEQYWTLMADKSFELETVETAGLLLSRQQFHGINNDKTIYRHCMDNFSSIMGHYGELTVILRRVTPCPNGGIFYLDTMDELDQQAANASTRLSATLRACGAETLVCANFCYDNPYRNEGFLSTTTFAERLRLLRGLVPET